MLIVAMLTVTLAGASVSAQDPPAPPSPPSAPFPGRIAPVPQPLVRPYTFPLFDVPIPPDVAFAPVPQFDADTQVHASVRSGQHAYEEARSLLEAGQYERALAQFDKLIAAFDGKSIADMVANRVDAALYWKAYVQTKTRQLAEAEVTLREMEKRFAASRWLKDAKALGVEVRQAAGQTVSPDAQADDDLKLLAVRGLMHNDPDRAVPVIEQMLSGSSSVRVKENALFVLSQSRSPRAREILTNVAKGAVNPDLQLRAIRYLGIMGGADNGQILEDAYRSTSDRAVKHAIIHALFMGGHSTRLIALARGEKDLQPKKEIVEKLSVMKSKEASDYLFELLK
jgi:HEAT repeat protein